MSSIENYLIETSDALNRVANDLREVAAQINKISESFLAKAVELDTERDRKGSD